MSTTNTRRAFLLSTTAVGSGIFIACRKDEESQHLLGVGSASAAASARNEGNSDHDEKEVTATEDLMREHGVIRRALVVYREAATHLRDKSTDVPRDALQKTAKLLRSFGEDYHEKKLEEKHIFPALKRAGGAAAAYVDVLVTQHDRGREINDYVIAETGGPAISPARAEPLARVLDAFARMYEEHAAVEDTIVFPAWKKTMSQKDLEKMGDLFEDIEHKAFGKDGFDDAVDQIAGIERAFRIELAHFTPPPPPRTP